MTSCGYCITECSTEALARLVADAGVRTYPRRRHGHRLWRVPTVASVYLFWCPDRDELPAVVGRHQVGKPNLRCARPISVAELRAIVADRMEQERRANDQRTAV